MFSSITFTLFLSLELSGATDLSSEGIGARLELPPFIDNNPEGWPAGHICLDKLVLREEIVHDEELQCQHIKQKSCFNKVQTLYKQSTVEECKEIFKKNCFYQYVAVAKEQKVKICQDTLQKDCSIKGDVVCEKHFQTVCETTFPAHEVMDDAVICNEISVPWCEKDENGEEICVDVPKKECFLYGVNGEKITPFTDCHQKATEVCGPKLCPLTKGERVCRDETRIVVTEVPEETCDIVPKKECNDVIKIVPSLENVNHCEDIPKEVCTKVRVNPRKQVRPHLTKWCGTKEDVLRLQKDKN